MLFALTRFLLFSALALGAVPRATASDITKFPVEYDVLTVTSELQVEALVGPVQSTGLSQVSDQFKEFIRAFNSDVSGRSLSVAGHNKRIDDFLKSVDALFGSNSFSVAAEAAISSSPIDFFVFRHGAHAATWDVLYATAATVIQTGSGDSDLVERLGAVDAYMVQNIGTASSAELQTQSDRFFATAEAAAPGFRDRVYDQIAKLYSRLWVPQSATDLLEESAVYEGDDAGDELDGSVDSADGSDNRASGSESGSGGSSDANDFAPRPQKTKAPAPKEPADDQSSQSPSEGSAADPTALAFSVTVIALIATALVM